MATAANTISEDAGMVIKSFSEKIDILMRPDGWPFGEMRRHARHLPGKRMRTFYDIAIQDLNDLRVRFF